MGVYLGCLPRGGVCLSGCLPRGCLPGGVFIQGVLGVSAQGSVCLEGVHLPLDPETDTHTCEQNGRRE